MIIDCHTHLNDYDPEHTSSLSDRVSRLEESMSRNGVDYALVLTSYAVNEHRPSTADVRARGASARQGQSRPANSNRNPGR